MVWHHGYSNAEVMAVTGLSEAEVTAALRKFDVKPEGRPKRAADAPLLVVPYPGGRHPRIGSQETEIDPQRETKASVFLPWAPRDYVVVDVPEAIWWNRGGKRELLYLAHTHIPTTWDKQHVKLQPLEWEAVDGRVLRMKRELPNGVVFGTEIHPQRDSVRMELWLSNGTKEKLTGLIVQNCLMLKMAAGFTAQTNKNKLKQPPYMACHNESSDRWIITAWDPCHRTWGNEACPCLHSDPQFPDCPPGKTVRLRGWLSFYEGKEIRAELDRIERTNWRQDGR